MQSLSSFDPGRMAEAPVTEEQPSKKAKTWASTVDTSTVHKLNFTDKVSWEKATHPDAFPLSKPKDVLYIIIKPLQLENWQTKFKTDCCVLGSPHEPIEGLAAAVQHQQFLSDMSALCRVGKCV